jgi:nucleoside-diphosphate-sugar epimerase
MSQKTVVVAGALGVAGRAMLHELEHRPDVQIIALSRRKPDFVTRAKFIALDLTDPAACDAESGELASATHLVFAAYSPAPTLAEEVPPNLAMLVSLVSTLDRVAPRLRHVSLVQGSKWYGNHLGPFRTPAREDDPRHMPPNFYYDQQDWLSVFQVGRRWTWSSWRPHGLCGVSVGSAMNQLHAIALYATISKELGLPLRFPGHPGAFRAVYQFTDATLLARAMLWASDRPECANQAFNINNGDYDRWENIWPAIAADFGMEQGPVQSISLARMMADKEPLWAKICQRHGLRPYPLGQLVNWSFADWVYSSSFDQMSSLAKVRRAGWHEVLEPDAMFRSLFARMREERLIP